MSPEVSASRTRSRSCLSASRSSCSSPSASSTRCAACVSTDVIAVERAAGVANSAGSRFKKTDRTRPRSGRTSASRRRLVRVMVLAAMRRAYPPYVAVEPWRGGSRDNRSGRPDVSRKQGFTGGSWRVRRCLARNHAAIRDLESGMGLTRKELLAGAAAAGVVAGVRRVGQARGGRSGRLGVGEGAVRARPGRAPLRRVRARLASAAGAECRRAPPPRPRRRPGRLPARARGRARRPRRRGGRPLPGGGARATSRSRTRPRWGSAWSTAASARTARS